MDMTITRIDLRDLEQFQSTLRLHRTAFGGINIEKQLNHNCFQSPAGAVFFGAFDGQRLIGVNGFVRHSIALQGRRASAFQSCSTATDPAYRGKGVFSALIRHAQKALVGEGVFIFGFPNENSRPIFVGPLGFQAVPMVKVIIPGVQLTMIARARNLAMKMREEASGSAVHFDQTELFNWKKSIAGLAVGKRTISGVTIWGMGYIKEIAGLKIKALAIGGMSPMPNQAATDPVDGNRAEAPLFFTLTTSADSKVAEVVGKWTLKKGEGVFIYYPLDASFSNPKFEVFGGLADFYGL